MGLVYGTRAAGEGAVMYEPRPRTPPPTGRAAAPRPTVRVAAGGRAGSGAERDQRDRESREPGLHLPSTTLTR